MGFHRVSKLTGHGRSCVPCIPNPCQEITAHLGSGLIHHAQVFFRRIATVYEIAKRHTLRYCAVAVTELAFLKRGPIEWFLIEKAYTMAEAV